MLKRIYLDNYKCMVNFEFAPGNLQPMFGLNGSGKTSVFEALQALRDFVWSGMESNLAFPSSTLTRWDNRDRQTFEIDVSTRRGEFEYSLELSHDLNVFSSVVKKEILKHDGKTVFASENGQAFFTSQSGTQPQPIPVNVSRSTLGFLAQGDTPIAWFKNWLSGIYFLKLVPSLIGSRSEEDHFLLDPTGSNFSSWYRHFSLESPGRALQLTKDLQEVIDGFSELSALAYDISSEGRVVRALNAKMRIQDNIGIGGPMEVSFPMHELSDGQRVLIVLYSVLRSLQGTDSTLCLDEPANYVALSEIQPYLLELRDAIGAGPSQALVISHHPEVIDYFAPENATMFERDCGGPVRIRPFNVDPGQGLKASELVARGWDDE
ncbi:MAG: ATP/GTP-binding protein [Planctomycetaceae bacterium]